MEEEERRARGGERNVGKLVEERRGGREVGRERGRVGREVKGRRGREEE